MYSVIYLIIIMVRAAAPHNINITAAAEYHYYIHNPNSIINKETGFSLDFIIIIR